MNRNGKLPNERTVERGITNRGTPLDGANMMHIIEDDAVEYRPCKGRKLAILVAILLSLSCTCAAMVLLVGQQSRKPQKVIAICEPVEPECTNPNLTCTKLCITDDCVRAASMLLQNMDISVHPCNDFYQYACGRWHLHHELPSDRSHYDTFSVMKDQVKSKLKDLLQGKISDNDSNSTVMAKHLYSSCMNEEVIEKLKERPLVELIEDLGGWPVISSNWTEDSFEWIALVAKLRTYMNDILLSQWIGPDGKNSSVNIIHIDQAELGLPSREYYVKGTQQLEAYGKFMIAIAKLLGADPQVAEKDMNDVVDFETVLANLTIANEDRRNYTAIYYKASLYSLQSQLPLIDLMNYFSYVLPVNISRDEEVVVFAMPYLRPMSELVHSIPKRVIANYVMWRFIYNRVGSLDKRFLTVQQEYYNALYGTQSISPRWKTCTIFVNKNMGMAVGAMFVRKYFNENSKNMAVEMIGNIRHAFLEILDEVDWMDNDTRAEARKKAELMKEKIGFPEYILNPEELDKDYEGLEFKPDAYFENILTALRHHSDKEQLKLKAPVDRTQWVTSPAIINAFYTRSRNFITFPAGILQPPLYHQNYVRSLNYGGIGVVIGHEITHGFDDKGRQFDQNGNLNQWWNEDSLAKFQAKAECMVKQYGKYEMSSVNMKVNGINTQGENIADNGGIKQAFRAFKNWEVRHRHQPLLPGLKLSHRQLFFLNYAQIWCGTMRPEAAVNMIRAGAHSPGRFRVIGALSNSKDFNEAYNCPLGSPMNPIHKCEVW